jgi:transcription-repair coupling factor (superfamily II helicase)
MSIDLRRYNPDQAGVLTIAGAPAGHDARVISAVAVQAGGRGTLVVLQDDQQAALLLEQLQFFAPTLTVLSFPAWDCLPYDRVSSSASVLSQRAETLAALTVSRTAPFVVITTVAAMTQLVPPPAVFSMQGFSLRTGQVLDRAALQKQLVAQGFRREATVREAGAFAVRGDIIDIFPASQAQPVRIDMFGDVIESLKLFDAATQLSHKSVDSLILQPVTELFLSDDSTARFRAAYRSLFGAQLQDDPLYQAVTEGRMMAGVEHWLPLFYESMVPLVAYLPRATIVQAWQLDEALRARLAQVQDFYHARASLLTVAKKDRATAYKPVPVAMHYLDAAGYRQLLKTHVVLDLSPFAPADESVLDAGGRMGHDFSTERLSDAPKLYDHVITRVKNTSTKVLVACSSQGAQDRLAHVFAEHGGLPPHAQLVVLPLETGFSSGDLTVMTEQDILGDRIIRTRKTRKRSDEFTVDLGALQVGDLVVHDDHGIGRYEGLITLEVGGVRHDCLKLVYANNDRIFLPVENLDLLSRYGNEDSTAALDKLGGAGWQNRKARVKKRLRDMAAALMKIAAARALQEAPVMHAPAGMYDEFCARFPYVETEDQARAIDNVQADLLLGKPMDRLVCGDVGFGKTEVALRAAFIAATAGYQVAVVVPTTLLARQHTNSFMRRFAGLPLKIAQLSRFASAKEAAQSRADLAAGTLDIVIGTHALLAQAVQFARLGLVIVDEEQHFGVKQKEKLKDLQKNVHVLTLSATPIPRTMQLALSGVRELSLIATPPVDRLAVRTTVMPFDALIVREALMREHYRGGQSFFVVPHIEDLAVAGEELRTLVPELKIQTAHGQLPAAELENIITAFDDGAFEVLLSTNIVESGLDIPRANTIIIHKAGQFGLAQLYQLRGRVGRAKQRGFAYLTYPPQAALTQSAEQRLKIMETLDGLGAGFQLASHDMDLRGAGNLLGEEQSGHIREVGIELYQQMLRDAVLEVKAGGSMVDAAHEWSPTLNLGLPVLIPDSYVADLGVRLTLYRRVAALADETALDAFMVELVDRFGRLPAEVENLVSTLRLKILCKQAGIEKLDLGAGGALITFRHNKFADPESLIGLIRHSSGTLQIRPDMKLTVVGAWVDMPARMAGIQAVLADIAALVR